tara:strand:- start:407 stop:664 length:258 start_codon:yes stop_codon:yes gene_type:complete
MDTRKFIIQCSKHDSVNNAINDNKIFSEKYPPIDNDNSLSQSQKDLANLTRSNSAIADNNLTSIISRFPDEIFVNRDINIVREGE